MGVKKHWRGRKNQCRPGLAAGVPGAPAPGKINQKSPPLPHGGRGSGGWGQKSKLKARSAGGKEGKPPAGHRNATLFLFHVKHLPHRFT